MATVKTASDDMVSHWSARRISILLTIVALALWSYSITQAKLNIGFYGLIHSFPITFFIALAVLTIASAILWVSAQSHGKLLALQLLFLITALWLTPALIGSHPFSGSTDRNLGLVSGILEQGKLFHTWYLSWPGAHVLLAIMAKLGSIDLEPVIAISNFLIQLLWLLPLYVFLRNVLGEARVNYCWAGLWLFSLANWTGQEYLSPQGIAFLLMLILLALMTRPSLWKEGSRPLPFLLAGSFIIAAIAITHLLTALATLCILAAFSVAERAKKLAPLVVLCLLLIVCWDVIGGPHYTSRLLSQPLVATPSPVVETPSPGAEIPSPGAEIPSPVVETPSPGAEIPSPGAEIPSPGAEIPSPGAEIPSPGAEIPSPGAEIPRGILIFDPEYIVETNITKSLTGSESHIAVVQTRILLSSIFAVLGLVAAILALAVIKPKRTAISVLAMAIALLLLLPLAKQFGWELIQRLYLYSLPFMAYFGAMLLDLGRKTSAVALCLFLIAACPLFVISHYGNQAFDYWSPSHTVGFHYVNDIKKKSDYPFANLKHLSWEDNHLIFGDNFPEEKHYFVISQHNDNAYDFLYNEPEFVDKVWSWLDNSPDYSCIYVNPDLSLYVHEGQE